MVFSWEFDSPELAKCLEAYLRIVTMDCGFLQVLMCTRSDDAVERRRALEIVLQLVGRLGEEYVMLLPEAMPFLAELLEDPELHIQNGTRELLLKLERITGENLDEYLKM